MPIKPAFSAVELLLVAGVTAILVAIAVPGYLEAKVRAEVVDVQVKMRDIRGALAQYSIDYNGQLPPEKTNLFSPPPLKRLVDLSLISYEPIDRFKEGLQGYGRYYIDPYITFDYIDPNNVTDRKWFGRMIDSGGATSFKTSSSNTQYWYLKSLGPDQTDFRDEGARRGSNKENPLGMVEYDPSNGVFSLGEITRSD